MSLGGLQVERVQLWVSGSEQGTWLSLAVLQLLSLSSEDGCPPLGSWAPEASLEGTGLQKVSVPREALS